MNDDFDLFNKQIQASLANALKWGDGKLYTSDATDLDGTYLRSFTNAKDRQHHNCNACLGFLRRYGGLLDLPSTWFSQDSPHKGLMFVLAGAADGGLVGAGIPAEGLRSELHEVKRTIVAHALQGKLQGEPGNQAAGLIVRKDDFKPFVIRADGIDYGITSWE